MSAYFCIRHADGWLITWQERRSNSGLGTQVLVSTSWDGEREEYDMVPLYVLWNAPGEWEYFTECRAFIIRQLWEFGVSDFHLNFEKVVGFVLQRYFFIQSKVRLKPIVTQLHTCFRVLRQLHAFFVFWLVPWLVSVLWLARVITLGEVCDTQLKTAPYPRHYPPIDDLVYSPHVYTWQSIKTYDEFRCRSHCGVKKGSLTKRSVLLVRTLLLTI